MALIELKKVSKSYQTEGGEVRALQEIDLSMAAGEMVILSGKSGCGKTTLLNLIGALDQPTFGEVWVGGKIFARFRKRKEPFSGGGRWERFFSHLI